MDLHTVPPMTFRQVRQRFPWLLPLVVALLVTLALVATVHHGALLIWDPPITHAAVSGRDAALDRIARWVSRLGSTPVVLGAGAVGVVVAARRCRTVATAMLLTVAARPVVEWLLKDLVARPRPVGDRLVAGTGFSFPSGHVLAAAATWGFVPLIAALYTHRRWLWWTLTGATGALITLMAWSRVWLGVHWTSDVVASLALSFVALSAIELAIAARHSHGHGHGHQEGGRPSTPRAARSASTASEGARLRRLTTTPSMAPR